MAKLLCHRESTFGTHCKLIGPEPKLACAVWKIRQSKNALGKGIDYKGHIHNTEPDRDIGEIAVLSGGPAQSRRL